MMRTAFLGLFLLLFLLPACSSKKGNNSATVVKPRYHHRFYDRHKDRKTKRLKSVRMKS